MGSMVFLAVIIILVSGLIAYVGDLVGRKMGRKRLTLLGLRPRHTAIVISVGSGMLIALLTLIALLSVSKTIREQFFVPLAKVKAELNAQRTAVRDAAVELDAARRQTDQVRIRLSAQTNELAKTNSALNTSRQARAYIAQQLQDAQRRFAEVRIRLHANEQMLISKQADLASALRDVTRARAEWTNAKVSLDKALDELARVQSEFGRVTNDLHASQDELRTSQEQLRVSQDQLNQSSDQLQASENRLVSVNTEIQTLTSTRLALEDEVAGWKDKVDHLSADVELLSAKSDVLSAIARIGFSPLSFNYGQEILSGLVPADSNEKTQRAWVDQFFTAAEKVVRQRNQDLPEKASALLFLPGGTDKLEFISRREAIDALNKRLTALGTSAKNGVIVRLAPVNNVPVDGPAFIAIDRIELIPNGPAYTAGDVVASVTMDITPQTTTADILGKLADELLQVRLPAAVRAKGMVSINRRFDSTHPDALPDTSVSTVSWVDLLAAAEKARAIQGTVSLVARAHTTVNLYGPLRVDLDAQPVAP